MGLAREKWNGMQQYGRLRMEDEQVVHLQIDGWASSAESMKHPMLVVIQYMRTRVLWKEWCTIVEESWSY
jgi:hypothetical protein